MKKAYTKFYGRDSYGMANMLKELNLPLVGKHHSGIDDCRNITAIVTKMINDGFVFEVTSQRPAKKK